MSFKIDTAGQEAFFDGLAFGFAEWAEEARAIVEQIAPSKTGRYKRTIKATTWLDGRVMRGEDVKITGYKGSDTESGFGGRRGKSATIRAVVYTTNPLGHLLELGTAPHDIPIPIDSGAGGVHGERVIHHPGARRKPHFAPGVLASRSLAGDAIRKGAAEVSVRR